MKATLKKMTTIRGRAMLLCAGLAALVLTVGVAGAAEAKQAVPTLKKGVTNLVETTTALVGFVADGPVLGLYNNSDTGNATALALEVEPGKAPMTVNSDARVDNLNADLLDGKDSSEFLAADGEVQNAANADLLDGKDSTEFLAANSKAADSELLDGQDSTAFFSGETYLVKEVKDGPGGGEPFSIEAVCDRGDKVLSGGGGPGDLLEDIFLGDGPILLNVESWIVFARDEGDPSGGSAEALCADFGEPHQNA